MFRKTKKQEHMQLVFTQNVNYRISYDKCRSSKKWCPLINAASSQTQTRISAALYSATLSNEHCILE